MQDRTDAALAPDPTMGPDSEAPSQNPGDGDPGSEEDGSPEDSDSEPEPEPEAEPETRTAPRLGPGAELDDDELLRQLTALVFASPDPLSLARLVDLLGRPPRDRVRMALAALAERLEAAGLPLQVVQLKGGHALMTTPDQAEVVTRLSRGDSVERVSPAALETLAVVAYRQPVTKAEIEAIRGVQAGPILRSLVDRGLARVVGRADVPGHPLQYGTGRDFLDRFGLGGLGDLPRDAELARD
jgi:segregation and condensation protein B